MASMQKNAETQFPRSTAYNRDWVIGSVSGGANSLHLTEWLSAKMELTSEMRILDLGCGRAASSIFMAREFGVSVWATDLWFHPSENLQRIRDAGYERQIFPIRSDARSLPFGDEFFDAIVSIDAFPYFGTDDHYLSYLARFVKPGGVIAIALAGFVDELDAGVPRHLADWMSAEPALWSMHSALWWRRHWEKTGIVDVELADSMAEGCQHWLDWHRTVSPDNLMEIQALEADGGRNLTYNRVIARRRANIAIQDPIISIPPNYSFIPLLRDNLQ